MANKRPLKKWVEAELILISCFDFCLLFSLVSFDFSYKTIFVLCLILASLIFNLRVIQKYGRKYNPERV